jgi:hypothetical protein
MIECLCGFELVLADDDVGDGLLVVFGDGLRNASYLRRNHEGLLEGHRIMGNFHLVVFDGQFHLGGDKVGVLVDGDLVDRRIVFFLFLLSLLLLFLGSHLPVVQYNYAVALPNKAEIVISSRPHLYQFRQLPLLNSRFVKGLLSYAARALSNKQTVITSAFDSGDLMDHPHGYLLVFFHDFLLFSESLFVHGEHVPIFGNLGGSLLCADDLVEQNLIVAVNA